MSKLIHIFLAEDNPGDVELVHEALREYHIEYELNVGADGAEVDWYLERLGKSADTPCPDLLLLDLNLPQTHGYDLFAKFRAHRLCVDTPVIIVTSSTAPKDRERAAFLGAARYFRKPSDLAEYLKLGSVIRQLAVERGLLEAS
jgi:CheY-like chemotaxis protein